MNVRLDGRMIRSVNEQSETRMVGWSVKIGLSWAISHSWMVGR